MLPSVLQAITSVAAGTLVLSQLHAVVPFRSSTDDSFVPDSHGSVATTTTVQSCNISRSPAAVQLDARWPEEAHTDLYEIQLLDDPNGVPFAVYPTRSTAIVIDSLKHHSKAFLHYWIRVRSHSAASQSLSGGWRNHSAPLLCLYVQTDAIATSISPPELAPASAAAGTTFRLPVIRQSEYTDQVRMRVDVCTLLWCAV